ncbi:uncharacterized protein WM277_024347 [Molossus nigricans]
MAPQSLQCRRELRPQRYCCVLSLGCGWRSRLQNSNLVPHPAEQMHSGVGRHGEPQRKGRPSQVDSCRPPWGRGSLSFQVGGPGGAPLRSAHCPRAGAWPALLCPAALHVLLGQNRPAPHRVGDTAFLCPPQGAGAAPCSVSRACVLRAGRSPALLGSAVWVTTKATETKADFSFPGKRLRFCREKCAHLLTLSPSRHREGGGVSAHLPDFRLLVLRLLLRRIYTDGWKRGESHSPPEGKTDGTGCTRPGPPLEAALGAREARGVHPASPWWLRSRRAAQVKGQERPLTFQLLRPWPRLGCSPPPPPLQPLPRPRSPQFHSSLSTPGTVVPQSPVGHGS